MGWLKVIFIIGLSFVPVIGQIMWAYYLLKIGWKYIEMCIKVDFWTIYLIVSVFTQLPIYLLIIRPGIAGAHLFERFLGGIHNGVEVLHSKPKKAGIAMVLLSAVVFSFYPLSIQNISIDTLTSNLTNFGIIIAIASFVSIILAALADKFYSGDLKTASSEKEPSLDPMYGPSGAGKAKEAAREGMRGMYESKEAAHEVAETTEKVTGKKPWVPENMTKAASKLKGSIPFMDSKSATKKAGKRAGKASRAGKAGKAAKAGKTAKAGKAVAGAGAALGGWEAVIALLVALILGLIIFVVQFVAVMAIAGGIFYAYLPLLSGIFGDALGFGIDYGNYGGQILAPYMPSIDMQPLVMAVQGPIAKAQCFFKGPACFSEWQMNNTQRPGSEAVGQEYDLTVDGFEVANGQTIDVAYNNPGQPLSVSFALNNPRNGLRGIEANNVKYNLSVNRNNGASLCNTGFKSIELYTGGGRSPDTILPGDSWAFRSNEAVRQDITLRNCNLLQPGQIELTREAELQIKYEYGSQSNLDIRAMSYDNLDQQGIDRSFKESETADTPVKSYINAYAPVLFDEYQDGERNARPFDVQVGLKTDRTDIKYRVDPNSIRFTPSTATEIAAPTRCDFVPVDGTEDELVTTYKLEQSAIDQINRESFESDSWYDATRGPTVMECPLQIANPEDISTSGETLIMDVNADYTVIKEDVTYDFQTWNTLCSGRNCPFLVTQQDKQQLSDPENFLSTCSPSKRADASGGCDVRKLSEELGDLEDWQEDWQNPSDDELHFNYETIGRGQTAYRWDTADVIEGQAAHKSSIPNPDRPAIGVSEEDWVQITGPIPEDEEQDPIIVAVRNRDGESRDVDVEYLDQTTLCRQESTYSASNIVKGFANIWAERNIAEDILYTRVDEVRDNCQPSEGLLESVGSALGIESAQDRYNDIVENCNSIVAIRSGNFVCYEQY
jgi:hypothetical protein